MILHSLFRSSLGLTLESSVYVTVYVKLVSYLWRSGILISDEVKKLSKSPVSSSRVPGLFFRLLISYDIIVPALKNFSMISTNLLMDSLLRSLNCSIREIVASSNLYLFCRFFNDSTSKMTYFICVMRSV